MVWTDTHCHLDFPWKGELPSVADMAAMVKRAHTAGVITLINVGCDVETSRRGLELARVHEGVFCALGVHPNEADQWNADVERQFVAWLEEDVAHRIVGIGEIGLDLFRQGAPESVQGEAFRAQLKLAKAFDRAVTIHCREAYAQSIAILKEEGIQRAVFHCYAGDLPTAKTIWSHGWMTSFAGIVSYPKNEALREVVRQVPVDLYLVETDAPFLPHQSIRGQRNEPAEVVRTGQTVAEVRGIPLQQVGEETTRNAARLFRPQVVRGLL